MLAHRVDAMTLSYTVGRKCLRTFPEPLAKDRGNFSCHTAERRAALPQASVQRRDGFFRAEHLVDERPPFEEAFAMRSALVQPKRKLAGPRLGTPTQVLMPQAAVPFLPETFEARHLCGPSWQFVVVPGSRQNRPLR